MKSANRVLKRKLRGFTLAELIVVITILAILATVGFLALSGYSEDAKSSVVATNVRSLQTAISSESAITNNSPRYYVIHNTGASLSGAFVYLDGTQTTLTGGDWNVSGTNYSAGNPDYAKLKLNPEKFKTAFRPVVPEAFAA
ncbi:MAG: type II secretion system protein [Patescibacteria group bacterium]